VGFPARTVQAACIHTDDVTQTNRDSISIIITYHDGSVGTIIYQSLGSPKYPKEKLEIAADGQTIVLNDFRRLEVICPRKIRMRAKQDKGYDAEINAFISAVTEGRAAPIPFPELVETTQITLAIHQALSTGETIEIPESKTFD
jgi:predicted dehydrogenase